MDRVRFGRALGGGARDAAKALLRAADAAAAPDPSQRVKAQSPGVGPARDAVRSATTAARVHEAGGDLKQRGRKLGEALWGPLAKQSGVLWLEFTGVFFGLFALSSGIAVWQHRAEFFAPGSRWGRDWLAVLMLIVFAYLTISSFVRAARRARQ